MSQSPLSAQQLSGAPGRLPPIEQWWPFLTIGSRHTVLRDPTRPLEYRVVAEVQRATGHRVDVPANLSADDLSFLAELGPAA
jgi:hypothetical protein